MIRFFYLLILLILLILATRDLGARRIGCTDAIRVIRAISGSLKYTLILVEATTIFLFIYWFYWFLLRIGGVRALVSASVKSGKSVDNKKRGALRASMIWFFIYWFYWFYWFCYARLGRFFKHWFYWFYWFFATHGCGTCACLGFS